MFKKYLICFFIILFLLKSSANLFGYKKHQQHLWPKEFKQCGGKMQSPVAISTSKVIVLPLPALEMNGYHNILPRLSMINNGYSVSLSVDSKPMDKPLPHIFGATLNDSHRYELEGLHFHWGMKNNRGSEHVINGVRYPMEMHIIHRNTLYTNIKNAQQHKDGLVVLAAFFQLQDDDNDNLNPILRNLQSVQWKNTAVKMNISITLNSILPKIIDTYYIYKGSLTTPPCSEVVTWFIFSNPIPISFRQMNKFRLLSNGEDILADNYRKLQELGNRKVYLRKITNNFTYNEKFMNFNFSNLEWFWK
ncbi:carbonic anhydrase 2-like [Chelonus insularis]|uniref:carbonic anhydrase 2-like n=1 Tax=Chelonus insularis TaxID=460826 RepID=UPI001589BF51|nr:carbonic anhydrase 2-like [Chelonus insularis]